MRQLYEEVAIGTTVLENRFVRSATHEGFADENGFVTDELLAHIERVARGGVGLVISGHAYVSQEGKASPRQLAVLNDQCEAGLAKMSACAHKAGAKIFLQLAHAGQAARVKISGMPAYGPTTIHDNDAIVCQGMDDNAIAKVRHAFIAGALRAQKAGFDGVQLHAAHGYLLSQFLSPYYNMRSDAYGGHIENRGRLLIEIVQEVKQHCGQQFSVSVKMNSEDFVPNGYTVNEMLIIASLLEDVGVDSIELSGGTPDSGVYMPVRKGDINSPVDEVYYREACARFKERVSVPLIVVGGIRSFDVARTLVEMNLADLVALSRPLIREPELIQLWAQGRKSRAQCISCNACFRPLMTGRGLRCVFEKYSRGE